MHVTYNQELVTYSHLLKSVSYELRRGDADVIYKYFVFSRSDLQLLVDRYFERVSFSSSIPINFKWERAKILNAKFLTN